METATKKLNIFSIIAQSFKEFPIIFKRAWLPLFILTIPLGLFQQYLLSVASETMINENYRLGIAIISLILSLLETTLLLLITPQIVHRYHQGLLPNPFTEHIKKHLKPTIIETFRAIGMTAVGFIMLIVPGVKRVIHFMFVAFVVQFSAAYSSGQVDALEESKKLIKPYFALFFALFILTTAALISVEVALARWNFFVSPLAWGILTLLNLCLEILIATILVTLYEKLTVEKLTDN